MSCPSLPINLSSLFCPALSRPSEEEFLSHYQEKANERAKRDSQWGIPDGTDTHASYFAHRTVHYITYFSRHIILIVSYAERFFSDYVRNGTWVHETAQVVKTVVPYLKLTFVVNIYYSINSLIELCLKRYELDSDQYSYADFMGDLASHLIQLSAYIMEIFDGIASLASLNLPLLFQLISPLQVLYLASSICAAALHIKGYFRARTLLRELEEAQDVKTCSKILHQDEHQEVLRRIFESSGEKFMMTQEYLDIGHGNPSDKESIRKLRYRIESEMTCHLVAAIANSVNAIANTVLLISPLVIAFCPPLLALAPHIVPICYVVKSAAIIGLMIISGKRCYDGEHFSWNYALTGAKQNRRQKDPLPTSRSAPLPKV